jgi:acyl carrier protein
MLQVFLNEPGVEECNCMRVLKSGSEALPVEVQERFFDLLGAELHYGYGPTETSIGVTYAVRDRASEDRVIPIGRPIGNTQVHMLDVQKGIVPVSVPGEMHIGGECLARGYLNRAAKTAETFVPNPYGEEPGARLYKTGDVARRLPDGDIVILGRTDHQVKIRGMRIEPGEIEVVLKNHPAVSQVVVMAREDKQGDKRLVAYVVPVEGQSPGAGELRAFMQEKLPDHMVPSAYVMLEALPLLPNSKLDRRALPVPDWAKAGVRAAYVAPRIPAEEVLSGIWAEVLKVEQVGIHDNFFELGGHSLLATQVVSRVRDAFQAELPLRALFETPTLSGLAQAVIRSMSEQKDVHTGTIQKAKRENIEKWITNLDRLSDEEVDQWLKRIAGEEESN